MYVICPSHYFESIATLTPTLLPTPTPNSTPILFPKAAGWENISINNYATQIDDVLYVPGISVPEFIALVESSSIEYTYEYNENRLVMSKEYLTIPVFRDGQLWFEAGVFNFEEVTKPLKELYIRSFIVSPASLDYSYWLDGVSYQEIKEMSYSEVVTNISEKYGRPIEDDHPTKSNILVITLFSDQISPTGDYTLYNEYAHYQFSINKDTGKVESLELAIKDKKYFDYDKYKYTPIKLSAINSFAECTPEELDTLAKKVITSTSLVYSTNIVGYCLAKEETSQDTVSLIIVVGDSLFSYVEYYVKDFYRTKTDNTLYFNGVTKSSVYYSGEKEDIYERLILSYPNIFETTLPLKLVQ